MFKPNYEKIVALPKLKAFADKKLNVTKSIKSLLIG